MQMKTKQPISFLILYFLTSSFYISRILSRYIFENAYKWSWIIILGIALLILVISPFLYRLFQHLYERKKFFQTQKSKFIAFFLYVYLFLSSFMTFLFLLTLINTSWLMETRYTYILIPLLLIIYYVLNQKQGTFLRLVTIFVFPILIQYLIFVFANNKSMDLYALLPYQTDIIKPSMIALVGLQMILHPFLGLFYMGETSSPISRKAFYFMLFFFVFSLCYDAIVVCGQFGNTIADFPFVYYESWRLLSFGQYLSYLDIFAFFYWVTSSFTYVCLCLWLIKKNYSHKTYLWFYILLFISLIFILTHGTLYHLFKPSLVIVSTVVLIITIFSYLRKVV